MQSLDESYTEADLRAFHARLAQSFRRSDLTYIVEPKFDGLAVSVTFEKGKLVRAVTRGNGVEGDDDHARTRSRMQHSRASCARRRSTARRNPVPGIVESRGEIYLPWAEFVRINREREAAGEVPFSHPRNLAAGTLQATRSPARSRSAKSLSRFYGLGRVAGPVRPCPQRSTTFTRSCRRGACRVWRNSPLPGRPTKYGRRCEPSTKRAPNSRSPSMVPSVKLDAVCAAQRGRRHRARAALGDRLQIFPDRAETQLLAITLQVGRTGVLTPVAELAPVQLAGSTIARATLHNRDEINRSDLRVGDFVYGWE